MRYEKIEYKTNRCINFDYSWKSLSESELGAGDIAQG
jgi:hypothetical protein